jgi:predicted DNA-binding transcriptional regulator AlpA
MARHDADDLLGLAEVADLLGTSTRQVLRWTERDDFPAPIARLRATAVWDRPAVEKWSKQRKPNGRRKR